MSERGILICLYVGLMVLQILFAALAIVVHPGFAALAPLVGGFQSKLPDPFAKAL
jgi:hypothetical protein